MRPPIHAPISAPTPGSFVWHPVLARTTNRRNRQATCPRDDRSRTADSADPPPAHTPRASIPPVGSRLENALHGAGLAGTHHGHGGGTPEASGLQAGLDLGGERGPDSRDRRDLLDRGF